MACILPSCRSTPICRVASPVTLYAPHLHTSIQECRLDVKMFRIIVLNYMVMTSKIDYIREKLMTYTILRYTAVSDCSADNSRKAISKSDYWVERDQPPP